MHVSVVAYGEDAALLQCEDRASTRAALAAARAAFPLARDIVPGARTVLVDGIGPRTVADVVAGWHLEPLAAEPGPRVEIPVRYGGPDLPAVAAHWGMSVEAAVTRHRANEYVVEFCGFAPGFAYCSGLAAESAVPRLETPRTRVPAGAVAVADAWTAVYPTASPGGWQLLGTTSAVLWDPTADQPALLQPGTRVVFVDA